MKKFLYVLFFSGVIINLAFIGRFEKTKNTASASFSHNYNQKSTTEEKCTDCHSDLLEPKYIHAAIQDDCETCHSPEGVDHPGSDGFTLSEKVPALCYFCHDEMAVKKHVHYPVGEGECFTCHDVHSSEYKSLLINDPPSKLCYDCHDNKNITEKTVHKPIRDGACQDCHDPHQSDNSALLKKKGTKLCFSCHKDLKEKAERENLHYPFDEDCSNCHNAHNSDQKKLLNDKIPLLCNNCHDAKNTKKNVHYPIEEGECMSCHFPHSSPASSLLIDKQLAKICENCHDTKAPEDETVHYPFSEGDCASCHNPHQSDNSALLNLKEKQLCFNCHEETQQQGSMSNIHPPFEEDCSGCHKAHSSKEGHLLRDKMPDLCYECHEEVNTKQNVHGPVAEGSCAKCHSPHASNKRKFLHSNEKELCLSCHNKTIKRGEDKVTNINQVLKKNKFVHAPLEDGCTECHKPHSSDNQSLLSGTFPEGLYAPAKEENFALCFDCHDSAILDEDAEKSGTGFRNGKQNLHYIHINGKKGRSCNVCHNVHAAMNEHLIDQTVMFGNWEMPMGFTFSEKGGSCATGCHAEKKYER
ncbi:cytochrome c3 family protein [Bacteroidota bacterium]